MALWNIKITAVRELTLQTLNIQKQTINLFCIKKTNDVKKSQASSYT